jgi:hypothetical protein
LGQLAGKGACRECGRRFNERTGTALNRVPTDIVFLVVFWRLR